MVTSAAEDLVLCSPYISASGVDRVFDLLDATEGIRVFSRLSPSDWATGVSNPASLLALLDTCVDAGKTAELHVVQRLHAKIYAADRKLLLLGSANLTHGGFAGNLEMMVELRDEAANDALTVFEALVAPVGRRVTPEQLRSWIDKVGSLVERLAASQTSDAEALAEAQRALDQTLKYGQHGNTAFRPTHEDLEKFISWIRSNQTLAGAATLLERYENRPPAGRLQRQNLQGHVKQCFMAAMRFFVERPDLIRTVADALVRLRDDKIYPIEEDALVAEAWIDHVDRNATAKGDSYDYAVLRGILPPSLGGTRQGGGGGSSTLKRMLPLVAQYQAA